MAIRIVPNKDGGEENDLKQFWFERWMSFCSNYRTILKLPYYSGDIVEEIDHHNL